jgi:hypothetical protein
MEGRSAEMGTTNPDKNLEEKIKESGGKLESPPTSAQELLPLLDVRNFPLFFVFSFSKIFSRFGKFSCSIVCVWRRTSTIETN